jgi:release factor glutamine methyltransferase
VAAEEEAADLMAASAGDGNALAELLARRCEGEPIAWLVGSVRFCGVTIVVHKGVYVPRWQSEPMALAAASRLPERGTAVDLCTGSGAIATVLSHRRPRARVLATESDPLAVACARENGVDVVVCDMADGVPSSCRGEVDVVVGVVPYVPTGSLRHLPRDVVAYEPLLALDGGPDGTRLLAQAVLQSAPLLRPGGSLLLEVGGEQADVLAPVLEANGYAEVQIGYDEDGDVRSLSCRRIG